jgi:hypothetical protein
MLDTDAAIRQAADLYAQHQTDRIDFDVVRRYVTGKQPIPAVVPTDAPPEVREMARISRINLIGIVVKALVESLYVDSFRVPELPDNEVEAEPSGDPLAEVWRTWQANRLDRGQSGLYRAVHTYGHGYMVVTPGRPYPVSRPVSPRKMIAVYAEETDDYPVYALEKRRIGYRLYDDEAVYTLALDNSSRWEMLGGPAAHGRDYCPVIRYLSESDLDLDDEPDLGEATGRYGEHTTRLVAGEVAPLMTLQDQADVTTFSLRGAEWYSAFRQRWIVGWTPESRTEKMKMGASQAWTFADSPEDVRLGEFAQTELRGYLESRQATMKYGATLSQTPVHELIGELVNLSAEALTAAEAGRDRKVLLAKTALGESHELWAQTVGDYLGLDIPDEIETIWQDTSSRAFGAVVDGLGKLAAQLQIPPQALWERIPGVSRGDVRSWKKLAAEADSLAQLTGMLDRQAAGDPEETRTPSGLILPPGAAV